MKRRHANRNDLAWNGAEDVKEVRYLVVNNSESDDDPYWFDVLEKSDQGEYWMGFPDDNRCECFFLDFDERLMMPNSFEVTAQYLPYLEKPEGEFAEYSEFRLVAREDSFLLVPTDTELLKGNGHAHANCRTYESQAHHVLSGYRWCKPRSTQPACPKCSAPLPKEMFEGI